MRVFAFGDITAVFDANHEVTGYSAGDDVISAERNVDAVQSIVGADGSMAVAISADRSGRVTFKLLQTSSTNKYLAQRYAAQENGTRTFVPINLVVKDVHRQDALVGIAGYLMKLPVVKRGANANEQEWAINFQQLYFEPGDMMGIGSPSITVENLG